MLSDLLFLSRRQLRRDVYCLDISNASDSSISQLEEKASYIFNLRYRLFLYNQQFRQKNRSPEGLRLSWLKTRIIR